MSREPATASVPRATPSGNASRGECGPALEPATALDTDRRYRMLVVDDNPSIHDDFRRIFDPPRSSTSQLDALAASIFELDDAPARTSFELDHASQGQAALERVQVARELDRPYALAFMDVRMPQGWDGVETCARILAIDPDVHVVLCTAYPEHDWRARVEALEGRDRVLVLKKPFDVLEVQQLAHALCERWAFTRRDRARMRALEHSVTEQRGRLAAAADHLRHEIASRTLAESRLRKAQRLEGLGRLAAGLCHEINNPLSFIVTSAELLEQELDGLRPRIPEATFGELGELVHSIEVGASRIVGLVRNIKMFARSSEAESERLELRPVCDAAIEMIQRALIPAATIEVDLDQAAPVLGQRLELEQVLINLIENALHALGAKPPRACAPRITITARRHGRVVSIEVADNGPGIDPEHLDALFDPFFTTKPVGTGTGLGLSICHTLVQGMAGTLDVRNNARGGATFTVTLPVALPEPAPARAAVRQAARDDDVTARGRVLVIDDEPLVLSAIRRLLRPHEVVTATGVEEALARCDGETYDLILCDVMMPGQDGRDFHARLAAQRPGEESRVVFITGGGLHPQIAAFLERLPNPHLEKPFDSAQLRELLAERLRARSRA